MPRLALLLRDLYPPRAPEPGEAAVRLSAFEHWLARGDARDLPGGWRGWLATAMLGAGLPGGEGGAGLAAGALLAAGPGRYFWFATPVHFVAGLDTLHLPVTGLLALSVHEQQSLVADFLRAFQGAPWRLAEIAHVLHGSTAPAIPEGMARAEMIAAHYDDMLSFYGTELGLRCARKHLGWYLEEAGLPQAREAILTSTDPAEVLCLLGRAFAEMEAA